MTISKYLDSQVKHLCRNNFVLSATLQPSKITFRVDDVELRKDSFPLYIDGYKVELEVQPCREDAKYPDDIQAKWVGCA